MKNFQPRDWDWHCNEIENGPKHSFEYIARREAQLEAIDNITQQERALIAEYGFDRAMPVLRQYYGRWGEAREVTGSTAALIAGRAAEEYKATRPTDLMERVM